jgi:hypothetical protein
VRCDTPKIYHMLRRVLKNKQADRMLWAILFVLTLIGVAIAIELSLQAEEKTRWVGGTPPGTELENNSPCADPCTQTHGPD